MPDKGYQLPYDRTPFGSRRRFYALFLDIGFQCFQKAHRHPCKSIRGRLRRPIDEYRRLFERAIIRRRSAIQHGSSAVQLPVCLYDQLRNALLRFRPALGAKGLNPFAPSIDERTEIRRDSAPEIVGAAIALKEICRQESPATFVADNRNKPRFADIL